MLSTPSEAFPKLIQPLITPETIPNTLMVILLDWSTPHLWMRQLREWILFTRSILESSSHECQAAMEEVMVSWRDRGRGSGSTNLDGTGATTSEGDVALPLGPGEWEEGIGLPLCVVCQNVRDPGTRRRLAIADDLAGREDGAAGEDAGLEGGRLRSSTAISADGFIETYVRATSCWKLKLTLPRWRISHLHHTECSLIHTKSSALQPRHQLPT